MKSILIITLLSCFCAVYEAKIFSKCKLAHMLKTKGMDGYHGYSLADFCSMSRGSWMGTVRTEGEAVSDEVQEGPKSLCHRLIRVCMAQYESNFNTRAFNGKNANGSSDYGLFQLNSKWWCKNSHHSSANACNIMCSKFLDDNINDDIVCAKRVVRDPKGMSAWMAWVKHCKGKDLSKYLASCKL
ncbi:lysozyme C, milk isozyme isoform X1 [Mustela nigripes]|nr:lysozyme C, milk isozyme isoform X1 [Mustela nigripes]